MIDRDGCADCQRVLAQDGHVHPITSDDGWDPQQNARDYAAEQKAALDYMCPNCVTPWKCNGPHIAYSSLVAGARVP